jgi:aromatic ring-opening dioxygenase catalytic subunit (LigB family)
MTDSSARMPVAFVPHGGGPWPFVEMGLPPDEVTQLKEYLKSVRQLPPTAPRALLVISAHWEEPVPTVMTAEHPPMLYDYYGFPPESYQLQWPTPGDPNLAHEVAELLGRAGFKTGVDAARGFDHGAFVPLKVTYPDADIPAIQLSLMTGLNPAHHIAIGRALAPLRERGVFIVGSGMTFHNLRAFGDPRAVAYSEAFDEWLRGVMQRAPDDRARGLTEWSTAPAARIAHPREEHLIPLLVATGAAGDDPATLAYNGTFGGTRLSAYHFVNSAGAQRLRG